MRRIVFFLTVLTLAAACGIARTAHAQQRPPGVICAPSTWTPSPAPPMTGWCMWQPSYYMNPLPQNLRMCDARLPAQTGEVEIHDQPNLGGNCAVLNWSVGGFFDWAAFQYYGWADSPIRSMVVGPNTSVMWTNQPLGPAPSFYPPPPALSFNTTSGVSTPETFNDLWVLSPGFAMAAMRIYPPTP